MLIASGALSLDRAMKYIFKNELILTPPIQIPHHSILPLSMTYLYILPEPCFPITLILFTHLLASTMYIKLVNNFSVNNKPAKFKFSLQFLS